MPYVACSTASISPRVGAWFCGPREAIFQAKHDDYGAIMLKAIADRLAEAFAELMHERVRKDLWGYAPDEQLSLEQLVAEAYRGIRPAPGYPACPDHSVKRDMFRLLAPEEIGMELTDSLAMAPAASSSLHVTGTTPKFWRAWL